MAKFKINLVGDTAEQEVSVKFTPKLKETFNSDVLNTLIAGFTLALQKNFRTYTATSSSDTGRN